MAIHRKIEIQAWSHPLDTLPKDVLELFSEQELDAYSAGAKYFKALAAKSGVNAIVELLASVSDDQSMFVDMLKEDDNPWDIRFGFSIVMKSYHPRIRLPKPEIALPASTPQRVARLYQSFGGLAESSYCGGFMTPEHVIQGVRPFVMDHHDVSIPDGSYCFYNFGNGDYAGWDNSGRGFVYDHERGTIQYSKFDSLFDNLFAGMNEDPFGNLE